MSKIKFIHCSDIHLDTPFKGLSNINDKLAERLHNANFESFKKIIDLCTEHNVDFLIISGDIFDSENKSLVAQIKFINQLKRLNEEDINVYFVCGNHDPIDSWIDEIDFPDNVYRFGSSEVENITYNRGDTQLAEISGISFSSDSTDENLAKKFKNSETDTPFSVAILHGTIGKTDRHETYAPFKKDDILDKNFDYWALGHIHKRQIIRRDRPAIVYSGNIQGGNFKETGEKGCYLVEIDEQNIDLQFLSTQSIIFKKLNLNIGDIETIDGLYESLLNKIDDSTNNDDCILKIILSGRTTIHKQINNDESIEELIDYLNDSFSGNSNFICIDDIEVNTKPEIDIDKIKKSNDFLANILNYFDSIENNKDNIEEIISESKEQLKNHQAKREVSSLSDNEKKNILDEAKWELINRLIKE